MLELEEHFVRHFNKESLRVEIVNNFLSFIRAIKNEGLKSFTIWIDGSFISNKPNPKDLDFLLLIENDQQKSIREILKKEEFNDKLSKRTLI
ncbi:unnamed protein product [marine sediment metagenome]|uniref:Polymerase nucleotidyl transferase domain-containing protein n=1 Tax=marine sediment metagenome TaxID=412755 RepID=X1DZ21_9ZZZZ